jgi:hypothetical protein
MKTNDTLDFKAFLEGNVAPPIAMERQLLQKIQAALHPALYPTLAKLFAVHFIGSFLTLLLCPQFSIGFSSPIANITGWLMGIHPALCFLACGSLWVFGGQALMSTALTIDEKRVSNRYKLGTVFSQVFLTILVFACLGYVSIDQWLAWWVVGAIITATAAAVYSDLKSKRRRAYAGV